MKESTPYRPDAEDFLEMWKHFNQMAHDSGIVKSALSRYDQSDCAWLNYYLYFNHYQVLGQTLLVYCLRELLDVAATHEFSDFDLTGYMLEPEQEYHNEEAGILRQALDDVDILKFASVRNLRELKETLLNLVQSEGKLKVVVLPELTKDSYHEYLEELDEQLLPALQDEDAEYVVLTPKLDEEQQVKWVFWVYGGTGATEPKLLAALSE